METGTLDEPQQPLAVKPAQSYKVGVKTKHNPEAWAFNGLRFMTPGVGGAQGYASSLMRRWPALIATTVEESDEAPNATYPVPSDRYPVNRKIGY